MINQSSVTNDEVAPLVSCRIILVEEEQPESASLAFSNETKHFLSALAKTTNYTLLDLICMWSSLIRFKQKLEPKTQKVAFGLKLPLLSTLCSLTHPLLASLLYFTFLVLEVGSWNLELGRSARK